MTRQITPHPESRGPRRTQAPPRSPLTASVLGWLAVAGLGITVALALAAERWTGLNAPGGWTIAAGRLTGLVGTYLMLIVVLLAGRLPALERTFGQDRLTRWHRALAPSSLVLIAAHGALTTVGYARASRTGLLHQFGQLLTSFPGVFLATVGFVLLIVVGLASARIARRRMRYETWWAIHLYVYVALALSFAHQLAIGKSFVDQPVARTWWTAVWLATAGTVIRYRVLRPLWRSFFHQLRVVAVEPVAPGVVSVVLRGRRLDRLPYSGGAPGAASGNRVSAEIARRRGGCCEEIAGLVAPEAGPVRDRVYLLAGVDPVGARPGNHAARL